MANQMKDAQLRALLKTVEAEVGAALKSEGARLAKAGEPDGDEPPLPPEGEGSAPAASPPPAAEGSAIDPGASAAAPGEAPADAGPPEGSAPGGEPAAPGGEPDPAAEAGGGDMEALKGEYMKLGQEDPEALKAHYLACVEALQSIMGGGEGSPPGPGGEASPPAPEGPPAMKAELSAVAPTNLGNGSDHLAAVAPKGEVGTGTDHLAAVAVKKNEALEAEVVELRKNQDQLINAFDKFLGSPLRKAITGVHTTSGSQEPKTFTRETAKAALNQKIMAGKLQKSDRERAIAFCVGNINLDDIKDLLA